MDFTQHWEHMKQSVRAVADNLVADFPDITAAARKSAEDFCNLAPPTDVNSFFQASQAQSAVTGSLHQAHDQLLLSRRIARR
jgi:hypothetical protein